MKPSKRRIRREKKKNEEIQRSLVSSFGKMKIATTHESYDVPNDLIPEILSRLPARSIARFRAVSRQWYSITTTPDFIKSFESTQPPSLLLTFQSNKSTWEVNKGLAFSFASKEKCQVVYSFPHHQTDGSYDTYEMTNTSEYWEDVEPGRLESVHGLVLLPGFVIWNPTMRHLFTLPKPAEPRGRTFLGYDPFEGKHKVVHLSEHEQPQVLTLGSQESWRTLIISYPWGHYWHWYKAMGCFNGILYFAEYSGYWCLMGFDLRSEKFNPPVIYPEHVSSGYRGYLFERDDCPLMIPYEGKLALLSSETSSGYQKVYLSILEDADGHEWTRKCLQLPFDIGEAEDRTFHGVTDAGELIFTSIPAPSYSSFRVLYFSPRRNSIRESLFEGIRGRGRHIVPNHIESLFSM